MVLLLGVRKRGRVAALEVCHFHVCRLNKFFCLEKLGDTQVRQLVCIHILFVSNKHRL